MIDDGYIPDECTCRSRPVRPDDIDPPEPKLDPWCPVHGKDPDYERDKARDLRNV